MRKLILFLLIFGLVQSHGQNDSLMLLTKKEDKFTYKKLILPTSLMVTGFLLRKSKINRAVNEFRENNFSTFNYQVDDVIQYVPIALTYSGNLLGFKSKHGYKQMITNHIISNLFITGVTYPVKEILKDPRPDETGQNAFPSGHTSIAFTNGMLHFLEYKDSNIWFASSGLVLSTTVGLMRLLNNRHWLSDVMAGAGLGMATAVAVFYINPFNFDNIGKDKAQVMTYPLIQNKTYGIGMLCRF